MFTGRSTCSFANDAGRLRGVGEDAEGRGLPQAGAVVARDEEIRPLDAARAGRADHPVEPVPVRRRLLRVHHVTEPLPVLQLKVVPSDCVQLRVSVTEEVAEPVGRRDLRAVHLAAHLVEGEPGGELRLEAVVHVRLGVRGLTKTVVRLVITTPMITSTVSISISE